MSNFYETDRAVSEYLLFHYGTASQILNHGTGPIEALDYPARCIAELAPINELMAIERPTKGLDLGCAVGRSAFEMSAFMDEVVGVDFSHRFIEAAEALRLDGRISYEAAVEGEIVQPMEATIATGWNPSRIRFTQGDAQNLPGDMVNFDLILLANLIDRLPDPKQALLDIMTRVRVGGYLVITSPYTWPEEYTPRSKWLGGFKLEGEDSSKSTLDGLQEILGQSFELTARKNLPFLIREHSRKFQWSIAEGTVWKKN